MPTERVTITVNNPKRAGTALIGTCAAHVLLDGVDLAKALDGFGGDRRIAALGNLEELASQVAPAKGDCDAVRGHLLVRSIAVALHDAAIPARRCRRRRRIKSHLDRMVRGSV